MDPQETKEDNQDIQDGISEIIRRLETLEHSVGTILSDKDREIQEALRGEREWRGAALRAQKELENISRAAEHSRRKMNERGVVCRNCPSPLELGDYQFCRKCRVSRFHNYNVNYC